MVAREQCKAESDFLLILLSQGYISTAGSPLHFPLWVAPQPAEVWVTSLYFQLQCEMKRVQDPWKTVKEGSAVQSIPCSAAV